MAEQDRLTLIGQVFARVVDTESARFARELTRVLAQIERDLLARLSGVPTRTGLSQVGRLISLRRDLRAAVTKAGYPEMVTRVSLDAVGRMAQAVAGRSLVEGAVTLGTLPASRIQALARLMSADLLGLGDVLAQTVWRAAVMASFSAKADPVPALAKAIETTRAQAQTLFDTQVSIVGRQIVAAEPTEPEQAYLYVGPVDSVVRPWCREQLGLVKTRDAIEALDNGQLPNPFLTGGGYSCRHSWVAVSDPALAALVNTNERAPGYQERVDAIPTRKASSRPLRRAA